MQLTEYRNPVLYGVDASAGQTRLLIWVYPCCSLKKLALLMKVGDMYVSPNGL